jgi:hypothetical protein
LRQLAWWYLGVKEQDIIKRGFKEKAVRAWNKFR